MNNEDFSQALHNALAEAYGTAQRELERSVRVELMGVTIERVVVEIPARCVVSLLSDGRG